MCADSATKKPRINILGFLHFPPVRRLESASCIVPSPHVAWLCVIALHKTTRPALSFFFFFFSTGIRFKDYQTTRTKHNSHRDLRATLKAPFPSPNPACPDHHRPRPAQSAPTSPINTTITTTMVDFTLSPSEAATRTAARAFATTHLRTAKALYASIPPSCPADRFRAMLPIYEAAVAGGLVKGMVPRELGGAMGSLVEMCICVEECYAVDPTAALTIFGTGLGLAPLVGAWGEGEGMEGFLEPFLKDGEGAPLASLVFSEPGGVVSNGLFFFPLDRVATKYMRFCIYPFFFFWG